jgi:hypothetical protein
MMLFGIGSSKKAREAESLSEGLKAKISELHLLVMAGELPLDKLAIIQKEMDKLKKQLSEQTKHLRRRAEDTEA